MYMVLLGTYMDTGSATGGRARSLDPIGQLRYCHRRRAVDASP